MGWKEGQGIGPRVPKKIDNDNDGMMQIKYWNSIILEYHWYFRIDIYIIYTFSISNCTSISNIVSCAVNEILNLT